MSSGLLTVLIIGAGDIAGGYDQRKDIEDTGIYSHAGAYQANGQFSLFGIYDTCFESAKKFQSFWDVERVFNDLEEIIDANPDVISVCTPDNTHYEIIKTLLQNNACRCIFAEKPLALSVSDIEELARLSDRSAIPVVTNFQRRFDPVYHELSERFLDNPENIITANCYYMKGLSHIGVSLIDAAISIFGRPKNVLSYGRQYNQAVTDYSYDFIFDYGMFNITFKAADPIDGAYYYHIFEFDILFSDGRITLLDNTRTMQKRGVINYTYSGFRTLDEHNANYIDTGYRKSMLNSVNYVAEVTEGAKHEINTIQDSICNAHVINAIIESFSSGKVIELE